MRAPVMIGMGLVLGLAWLWQGGCSYGDPMKGKPPATTSAPAGGERLTVSDQPNQIGLIANRIIEQDGRVVKIIYYRLADPRVPPPYKESDLVEAGVRTLKYDADGRAYRSETTGLTSVMPVEETRWKEDGSIRDITWSGGTGSVSHRNIYRGNTCVTELHYNADGTVAGIRGEVSAEHDLPAWGKAVDDVACSVLASSARGPFAGLGLWITARNTGKLDRKIVTIGKTTPEFLVEVRRADGTLVQQDPQYVKRQSERRQAGNPNVKDVAQTLSPGKAELVAWGRELSHWYADLPPGKYRVTVTCRSTGEFGLVSNTAAFEITDAQPAHPPPTQPATQAKD